MDPIWLAILAAIGIFAARVVMIAWRLKAGARSPTLRDAQALRDAKASLGQHRARLGEAKAAPKGHLEAAKRLSKSAARASRSRVDEMVDAYLPDQRT